MSYKRADQVLPKELMEQIQKYVDGDYLYIPRKENKRRQWGENTSTRKQLEQRNACIYEEYLAGVRVADIAEKYYLSEKSIQRIVTQKKKIA